MNKIKVIILLTVMSLFLVLPYNNAVARDCSNAKGFHEKLMCKLISSDPPSGDNPDNLWKKMKNFGGEKVGEEG